MIVNDCFAEIASQEEATQKALTGLNQYLRGFDRQRLGNSSEFRGIYLDGKHIVVNSFTGSDYNPNYRCKYIKAKGYKYGTSYFYHRVLVAVVLEVNIEQLDNFHIHHIDGNHFNNSLDNLEIVMLSKHKKLHAA